MALTNHVLVRLAAHRHGYIGYDRYCIIGDDVVIFNNKVATEYISILGQIGVGFNESDSI
jgi:hypothetical protein